jgi:3alpha(or 20beta)-hydroxysteroid dehydrogenase
MQERLAGKIVVVTGAARGMGAAEAEGLAREGAVVVGADIVESEPCAGVLHRRLDVSSQDDWAELAAWLHREFGRVDGLVNNAGITHRLRLGELGLADWNRVFAVNATGPMLGIQALMPLMGKGASIVNIASIAAATGHYPAAYTASKWALRGLSRTASLELGPRGIRVNTVLPGAIATTMGADVPKSVRQALVREIPLQRQGRPEDLVGLVVFLISDESAFITGAEIPVDGGHTAHGGMKRLSDTMRAATRAPRLSNEDKEWQVSKE